MKKVRKDRSEQSGVPSTILRMPTSVVTGGAGFLGSHLCDRLLAAKATRSICVDNLETGSLENIAHISRTTGSPS